MITNYTSFKPETELRSKYSSYILSVALLIWVGVTLLFGLIAYADEEFTYKDWIYYIIIPVTIVLLVGSIIAILFAILYYNSISYEIVEDEVHVNRGIITKTLKIVPYRTITNIEIKRGPYDRVLGIGTIELQTAGFSSNKMGPEERLDGIPRDQLNKVQQLLVSSVRKVRGSPATSHDMEGPVSSGDTLDAMLYEIRELKSILLDMKKE